MLWLIKLNNSIRIKRQIIVYVYYRIADSVIHINERFFRLKNSEGLYFAEI